MNSKTLVLLAVTALGVSAQTTVPAGTSIMVRTVQGVDGRSVRAGATILGSIDDAVAVGSRTVIARGAPVTLEVVAIDRGRELSLRMRDVTAGANVVAVVASDAEIMAQGSSRGGTAARRGVGLGALGAGVGAIAGGGRGAAIGAAVGGGVGATTGLASRGRELNVPPETLLRYILQTPLTIRN